MALCSGCKTHALAPVHAYFGEGWVNVWMCPECDRPHCVQCGTTHGKWFEPGLPAKCSNCRT